MDQRAQVERGVTMTGFVGRRESGEGRWVTEMARKTSAFELVWLIGLVSTVYLVGSGLFLTFLSVVFLPYSSEYLTALDMMAMVGADAVPACCYAAIGITGLTFLASRRYWLLGLSAVLVEATLAMYAVANPGSLPLFTDWLL